MNDKYKFHVTDALIGLLCSLFFISFATILTINFRTLYYFDINYLDIVENCGYSKSVVLSNYNALIDWCSPFKTGPLILPSFPQSNDAIIHFNEVKQIFNQLYVFTGCLGVTFIALIIWKRNAKDYNYLLTSSIMTLVIPTLVGLFAAINFSNLFSIFHEIFFQNDYWLFDPNTDPIITILPEAFFMHCAIIIILFQFVFSGLLFISYSHVKKKTLYKK